MAGDATGFADSDQCSRIEFTAGVPGDNIRYEPIGCDKDGNRYWWFDDTRLYCESDKPPPVCNGLPLTFAAQLQMIINRPR
jgi:hypothetical protein